MTVIYDKLSFMRRLESDGAFSREQAERLSEAIHEAMNEGVATRSDLAEVGRQVAHVDDRLTGVEERLLSQLALMRSDLKIWMGSVAAGLFAALGVLMAILKFVIH